MSDIKQALILPFVIVILTLSAYNLVDDKNEMHRHNDFFKEMREFKSAGGRNTAEDGNKRDRFIESVCNRVNILEFHLKDDVELTDCEAIYE